MSGEPRDDMGGNLPVSHGDEFSGPTGIRTSRQRTSPAFDGSVANLLWPAYRRLADELQCLRPLYTDLNGLICKMKVTVDKLVTFATAVLFERPTEVGQDPQRQQIDAEERLETSHKPDPASGPQDVLPWLQTSNPGADV